MPVLTRPGAEDSPAPAAPAPGPPTTRRHSLRLGRLSAHPARRQLRGRSATRGAEAASSPLPWRGPQAGPQLGPRACPRPEKPVLPGGPQPGSKGPGSAEACPLRGSGATHRHPDAQRGEQRAPGHARARPDPPRGRRASSARGPGSWTAPTPFGLLEGPSRALGRDLRASVGVEGDVTKPARRHVRDAPCALPAARPQARLRHPARRREAGSGRLRR